MISFDLLTLPQSKQYRSFDAAVDDQHRTEVCAVHWHEKGPTISGSLDGEVKIWSTSSDGALVGSLSCDSPHKGVNSISSSLKSGRILTSDILGTVALWDAVEGSASEGDDLDVDMAGEPEARSKPWKLKLADSINVKESNLPTTGENGSRSKQKSATCHVTQIHPREPLFAATGAWSGVAFYSCPDGETSSQDSLGKPIRYVSESAQATKRGNSEKTRGPFGRSIAFDQSGSKVAVGNDKGFVSLFDVESGSLLTTIRNGNSPNRAVAFTASDELLIGSDQCSISLYDIRARNDRTASLEQSPPQIKQSYIDTLRGHDFWITAVEPASDNKHIATSSANGQVKVWDIRGKPNRSVVYQIKEEKPVWSLCWKPGADGASFVTGSGLVSGQQATGNVRWYQISGTA